MSQLDFMEEKERAERKQRRIGNIVFYGLLAVFFLFVYIKYGPGNIPRGDSIANLPEYNGYPYAIIHKGEPLFDLEELVADEFTEFGELDSLGRCTYAMACIGPDMMPTEDKESIDHINPTGWVQAQYDGITPSGSLYNRSHLIAYRLTGETADEKNLITGTWNLDMQGMLRYENMIADYIKETGNHVLYRVTPLFEGDNLLAKGVQMEARSIEDYGDGIRFYVFVYNVQPGVVIDYATGESQLLPTE